MRSHKQIRRDAKRLFRLCLVRGWLDEARVRKAVQKVLEAKRRGSLTLLSYFQRLVKLERARHTAEVESATPLSAALQADILSNLDRLYATYGNCMANTLRLEIVMPDAVVYSEEVDLVTPERVEGQMGNLSPTRPANDATSARRNDCAQ